MATARTDSALASSALDPDGPGPDKLVGADRVLLIAHHLARFPEGVALEELARLMACPKSTVHRGLSSLRRAGFARQDSNGRYLLGDDFIRLAFENYESRPDHLRVRHALDSLVERFGETAHFMVLDGSSVIYRAKVDPSRASVRLSSAVGGSNPAHATAGGKVLLAQLLPDLDAVTSWLTVNGPLQARTEHTLTSAEALNAELHTIRDQGYALDRQENEGGVHCIAFAIWQTSPRQPTGAISISALAFRFGIDELISSAPAAQELIVNALGDVVR